MTMRETPSLRGQVKELVEHRISRRSFVSALVAMGVAERAAQALAEGLVPQPASGEMVEGTGGELTVRALEAAGIRYVFGIPGTHEVGFVDALVDRPEITYILGLHEGPIGAMADGYAKVSGQTAFVSLHTIAGAANALGQLVNSSSDGTPVVFAAGNQDSRLRGRGSFLEAPSLYALPAQYTKWHWDVLRADTIPEVLRRAFRVASTPPGGPVFVTVSKDLWEQAGVRAEILPQDRFTVAARLQPDRAAVDRVAQLLVEARQPLLVAGDETTKYGGRDRLVELAETLAAPVVGELVTGHGRINFPTRHPQYLGPFPGQSQLGFPFDLFCNAGGRMFSDFNYNPQPVVGRDVRVVQIGLDTAALTRGYPVDLAIVADPESALMALIERVRELMPASRRAQNSDRLRAISAVRARLDTVRRKSLQEVWNSEPISGARLAAEVNQAVSGDAIVVTETVTSDAFVADYIEFHNGQPGRLHLVSHGGNLGWGIGAACGAKLAAPSREVVLLSGDGSFQFGVQGLWTAARYDVPVLFVIFNNQNYQSNRVGLIKYGRRAVATDKFIGTFLGDPDIDHVKIAAGYGVEGERVVSPNDLGAALRRGLDIVRAGRPYVLDVVIQRRFQGAGIPWYEKLSVASMRQ